MAASDVVVFDNFVLLVDARDGHKGSGVTTGVPIGSQVRRDGSADDG